MKCFELEGTFRGHLVQTPCHLSLNHVADGTDRMKLSSGSHASAMGEGLAMVAAPLGIKPIFTTAATPTCHRYKFLVHTVHTFLGTFSTVAVLFQFCFKASTAAVYTLPINQLICSHWSS